MGIKEEILEYIARHLIPSRKPKPLEMRMPDLRCDPAHSYADDLPMLKPQVWGARLQVDLSPEAKQFVDDLIRAFPNCCPKCSFTHPSDMFRLTDKGYACTKCEYVLQPNDYWPSEIV